MSSPQIEPVQPTNNQSHSLYDKMVHLSNSQMIAASPRERAIREVQLKSKYKSGSYEDYENRTKEKGRSVFSQK